MTCQHLEPQGKARAALEKHLPLGVAWQAFRTPGANAYKLWGAFADAYEDAWRVICRVATELDPRTTIDLLPEWERSLGLPDPCFPPAETIEQRRARILFRLTKKRWSSVQDWKDLAALFGLVVRITPGWEIQKRSLYAMSYPIHYSRFPKWGRFRVYIDILNVDFNGYKYTYPLPYGVSDAEFALYRCLIERVKPANVIVIWNGGAIRALSPVDPGQGFNYDFPAELE
jgi:uncharacterized protein YmfQ (DUF2313 family)